MQPYCRNNSNYTFREVCCAPIKDKEKEQPICDCPFCNNCTPLPCFCNSGCFNPPNFNPPKPNCNCNNPSHNNCYNNKPQPNCCPPPKPECNYSHNCCHKPCNNQQNNCCPNNAKPCPPFHPPQNPYVCVPINQDLCQNNTLSYLLLGYYLGNNNCNKLPLN